MSLPGDDTVSDTGPMAPQRAADRILLACPDILPPAVRPRIGRGVVPACPGVPRGAAPAVVRGAA